MLAGRMRSNELAQTMPALLRSAPLALGRAGLRAGGFVAVRWKPNGRWAAIGLGLIFLGSFAQAAFHVAVEQSWVIYQCSADIDLDNLAFDVNAVLETPQCDKIAWSLFGLSMAGYNAVISLILALASFAVALTPERKA